jgi:hypothetical protein
LAAEAERLQTQISGGTPPNENEQQLTPANAEPKGEQPVTEQVHPAQGLEPTPTTPASDDPTWEQRFRTLQGKYSAEVPRLSADLKELRSQHAAVLSEIERLKGKKAEAPEPKSLVTDKDVEAFGSDLIDVIDRKAREVAQSMVNSRTAELEVENRKLTEQLTGVTERQVSSERRTYFMELAKQVPDYEVLNVDQGFIGWLAEVDPLSGLTRQDYLTTAWNMFDANRTASLFNAYKQKSAPPQPAPSQRQQLQRQVAPDTSKAASSTPNSEAVKVWSRDEIDQFYRDAGRGAYRGREADRARIEAEIDQAVAEGRVR